MGGREPLIVGGTGFYVRALVTPLHELPTLDVPRRAALATWLAQQDAALIEKWVERLDPARLVLGRTQHVRAIETAVIAGVRLSDALASSPAIAPAFTDVRYLVVDPGTSLRARIALRVEQMLARGWWDEVVELAASVPADAPAWNACGYGVLREAIAGTRSRDDAIQRVVIETRQYAKRQRTWNRHQLPAQHVTFLDSSAADAMTRALEWWDFSKEHIQ